MTGGAAGTNMLIYAALAALIVGRFLFRELRERTVRLRTIWIRPGILLTLTALLIAAAVAMPHVNAGVLAVAVVVGAALGVVTGTLVVRSTTFAPANERGAVRVKGSIVTVAVWLVAIALRLAARYVFTGTGAGPAEQFELNAGLLALIAAAFVVVALAFHRAIDRLAPEASALAAR